MVREHDSRKDGIPFGENLKNKNQGVNREIIYYKIRPTGNTCSYEYYSGETPCLSGTTLLGEN
jgi:hypothetical protein